jgi:outer membrane protein assembly factor BamB
MNQWPNVKRTTVASLILIFLFVTTIFNVTRNSDFAVCQYSGVSEKWVSPAEGFEDTIQSIVIDNGYIYVEAGGIYGSSLLYCIDAATGNYLWNYTIFSADFLVSNGQVYVTGNTRYNNNPVLLCLNASSGAELWKKDLNGEVGMIKLVEDYLIVTSGNTINAFYAGTGEKKWDYSVTTDQRFVSLIAADGYVCTVSTINVKIDIDSTSSYVYTLNASIGQKLWSQEIYGAPLEGYITPLNVTKGVLFVSQPIFSSESIGSSRILSFDVQNGTLLWKHDIKGKISDFAIADGAVYSCTSSGSIAAVNTSNGGVLWDYDDRSQFGSVIVADGNLYVSSTRGLSCFNAQTGVRIWVYQANDYNSNPTHGGMVDDLLPVVPTYSNGTIYFGWNGPQGWLDTTNHKFYALNSYTGDVVWEKTFSYRFQAAPVIANDTLYLGGSAVTTKSPTWVEAGAVIALNLQVTSIWASANGSTVTIISIAIIIAAAALVVLFFVRKKRKKKSRKV